MEAQEFVRECTMGGPGLDGYAYNADTYCIPCGEAIAREIAAKVAPTLTGTDDPLFSDSETCPQPIFFGEHPDRAVHCGECGEYLYGTDESEEIDA
jgi:ribosomal protein S27AE